MPQVMEVVRRDDQSYEAVRRSMVWNARIPDFFPAVIAKARNTADVVEAIRMASAEGLRVSVRSGGHNWFGICLRDDALLIDLSAFAGITIDIARMAARVGPAARMAELSAALDKSNVAFPIGHAPTVAIGGYLLGGGLGWNPGVWGSGCANVRRVELVTADGEQISASASQNEDLFFAARGGGPAFPAVATEFELNVHPMPRAIAGSAHVLPLEAAADVGRWLDEQLEEGVPPELELTCIVRNGPPAGASWKGSALVLAPTVFADSRDEAERILTRVRSCPYITEAIHEDFAFPLTFANTVGRAYLPAEHRYQTDNMWCDTDSATLFEKVATQVAKAPSNGCASVITVTPPAATEGTAFTMRGRAIVSVYAFWPDERADEEHLEWHRNAATPLAPYVVGGFVNSTDFSRPGAHPSTGFTPEVWERLQEVRERFDSQHLFHSYLDVPAPLAPV